MAELAAAFAGATHVTTEERAKHLAGLAERLRACGIDREYRKGTKPSDHAPLLLDLAGAGH